MRTRSGHIKFDKKVKWKNLAPAFRPLFLKFLEETQQMPEDAESLDVLLEENLRDLRSNRKPEGYNRDAVMRMIFPISNQVEFYVYARERDVSFPVASLRREAERFQGGFERTRNPCERLRAFHSDPDDAHPRKGWEPARPVNHDFEGSYARAGLSHRRDDLRDESLLGFPEKLQGQVELLRTDDLQRGAGPPELIREGRERGRWRDVHRDEPAERHGRAPSGSAATLASAMNRPRSSKRPRRWPSWTAVCRIFSASSFDTESSEARSCRSKAPREMANAAVCARATSRARRPRAYPKMYRPGTRNTTAHRAAAAALSGWMSAAPTAARIPATPPMASATVATSSYHVWRFTRFPPNQSP